MDASGQRALKRLRQPDGAALTQLAELVVQDTTSTPLKDIATPMWIAGQIATALEAITQGDMARQWVQRRIDSDRDRLHAEQRPLRHWLPEEVDEPLRKIVGRAWTPSEDLAYRLIEQPAVRDLMSVVLEDTVKRFAKRARSLDDDMLGGMGGRFARKGRSLGKGLLGNRAGSLAENLVSSVTDEMESVIDKRVKEFVGGATVRALKIIVSHLVDPEDAAKYAEFRLALLDVILDTPVSELAQEADKLNPEDLVDVVVGTLRSLVHQEHFVEQTAERVERAFDEVGDGTLGDWLTEVGLMDVWVESTRQLVARRLQAVVKTEAFETW